MNELISKAKRAVRFLFYKDLQICNQIKISNTLNNDELEMLFWKMSKADRHHSLEVLNRTEKYTQDENLLKLSLLQFLRKLIIFKRFFDKLYLKRASQTDASRHATEQFCSTYS